MLRAHDLRHGVAVEVLKQRHDLEEVRAVLSHIWIDTTKSIRASAVMGGTNLGRIGFGQHPQAGERTREGNPSGSDGVE